VKQCERDTRSLAYIVLESTYAAMSSFSVAISKFDEYNSGDPNLEFAGGVSIAKELLYAQRMSARLEKFAPGASVEVRLAVRCQHIGRWQIPRNTFPADRKGYLLWRNKLKDLHASIAESILKESGYGPELIERVKSLVLKKDLRNDKDAQLLEDVVCLVFIEFYLDDFALKHDDQKLIDILRKTIRKMSPAAKEAVTHVPVKDRVRGLLARAGDAAKEGS
jgi:hypothetical protein